ncbi:hypothetical protein H1230_09490 [Paenibacillus sp. 19GGS1-52]|uniref:hypothetical protein n=1 Tax=Paenibacillus sp. 19GGS1-52 TaxID=2758563 RepID=UPI001EFB5BBC|nr:hypothetical protein [Paenibacillus sp. 19GGS1-52]ULO08974.1 hypothetical protein H1230_09490 [Paenibacillus sp. 19GGS1-52]
MYHTVHMFYKFDFHYYSAMYEVLSELSKTKKCRYFEEPKGSHQFHLLGDQGIKIILKRSTVVDEITYSAIEIIMNPMRLLDGNDYLQLADSAHFDQIRTSFKRALNDIRKKFRSKKRNKNLIFRFDLLDIYSFKRVDFAINISTEHVALYMKLIKRANIPDGFQLYTIYNSISKRSEPPRDSFYIFRKRFTKGKGASLELTVNCYNKGIQMLENGLPYHERAMTTIRFEIQCGYNKIYRIIRSKNLNKQGYSQFLREDISAEVLHTYFKKTVGYGDYYTISKAKELIMNTRLKLETRNNLIETIELVNDKRGIWKARETVDDKKRFDEHIKRLHDIGINPVTIPIAERIDYLPCLFDITNQI